MKIDRISYQKIFPTGMAYLNHKIGCEIQLDETDNPDEAFQLAKQTVEKWNLESNPGFTAMEYMNGNGVSEVKPVDKRIGVFVEDIMSCPDLKTLETYKYLVKEPALKEAYDKKLKELQ